MRELELDGIHDDDEHVILVDSDGDRYTLRIDDALRASVRRDRPALGAIRATENTPLRPRDIQLMLRQGRSAEEIAESAGVSLEHIRRYEGPVLAEREFTAQRARQLPVGRGDGPSLGDMVAERLAARHAGDDVRWDAWRRVDGTWELELAFTAGGRPRTAHWIADLDRRSIVAEDDEARWLVDDDASAFDPGTGRARLTSIRRSVYDIEADGSFEESGPKDRPRPLTWRPRDEAPRDVLSPGAREGVRGSDIEAEHAERERREEAQRDHPAAIDAEELGALNARRGLRSVPPRESSPEPDSVWEPLEGPAEDPADEEALAEHSGQLFSLDPDGEHARLESTETEPETEISDSERIEESSALSASVAGSAAESDGDTVELTPLPGFDAADGSRSPGDPGSAGSAQETDGTATEEPTKKKSPQRTSKGSSKRASMPSWDEIVFGSKHD